MLLRPIQRAHALLFGMRGNLPFHTVRARIGFARIGEKAAIREFCLAQKFAKRRALFLRFGRKPRDKRRTNGKIGDIFPQFGKQGKILRFAALSAHELENPVLAVLQGNIEITDDFGIVADFGDQLVAYRIRITV